MVIRARHRRVNAARPRSVGRGPVRAPIPPSEPMSAFNTLVLWRETAEN